MFSGAAASDSCPCASAFVAARLWAANSGSASATANERAEGFGVCCKAKDTAPEFTVVWGEGGVYPRRQVEARLRAALPSEAFGNYYGLVASCSSQMGSPAGVPGVIDPVASEARLGPVSLVAVAVQV